MALPTNGTRYVGLDFLGNVVVADAGSAVALDKVLDCNMGYQGNALKHVSGITGQDSVHFGMYGPEWTVDTQLQTSTLLAQCQRSAINGLPPELASLSLGIGGVDGRKQSGVYINEVKISCAEDEEVKASYSGLGLAQTTDAMATPPTPNSPAKGFTWVGSSMLIGGNPYATKDFTATLKNGLKFDTSLDSKTATKLRLAEAVVKGPQEIEVSVTCKLPPAVAVTADWVATTGMVFVAKNTEATPKTFTLTLANLYCKTNPLKGAVDGNLVEWAITLEAAKNDLSAWTAAIA